MMFPSKALTTTWSDTMPITPRPPVAQAEGNGVGRVIERGGRFADALLALEGNVAVTPAVKHE